MKSGEYLVRPLTIAVCHFIHQYCSTQIIIEFPTSSLTDIILAQDTHSISIHTIPELTRVMRIAATNAQMVPSLQRVLHS